MTNFKKIILALMLTASISVFGTNSASAYVIDGSLADWGVTPGLYGASDWAPDAGIYYNIEDNDPAVSYLNPGYGGQTFDAEAIYATSDDINFYFAVVTGFPSGGADGWKAGDIALDLNMDGIYEYGIDTTGNGSFTTGSLYSVSEWGQGIWAGIGAPTEIIAGTELFNPSEANLAYNKTHYGDGKGNHYVIEGYMPISELGSAWNPKHYKAHWAMTCANDFIEVTATPEPATMSLFGLGLLGIAGLRKKRVTA